MSSIRKTCLLALGLTLGLFTSPLVLGANQDSLQRRLQDAPQGPIFLRSAKSVQWAEYCPDETCDVIRTKKNVDPNEFAGVALAYFFLVSDYIYLRSWKEDAEIKQEVERFLSAHETEQCANESGRSRSICILRSLADEYRLEVLFIRHDEGGKFVERIVRKDAIK